MPRSPSILADLVAIASTTGHEQVIAHYIAQRFQHSPLIEVTQLDNNVALCVRGRDATKAFIMSAHLDTVPAHDGWTTDPHVLTPNELDSDKQHGLGASDNKSGVAILMELVDEYAHEQPSCDMYFIFTEQEEDDNIGARRMARWLNARSNYATIGGIVIEPTDGGEFIGIGHRNGLTLDVVASGRGGHGSQQLDDRNTALEKISFFVSVALPRIRSEWAHKYSHPVLGPPTLNATKLDAGKGPHNVIPDIARLTFDFRSTPQLDEALPGELSLLEDTYGVKIMSPRKPDPAYIPEDAHILRVIKKALPNVPLRAFPGATDLPYFLAYDIPTVIIGPGEMAAMHQPNEWVRLSSMIRCKEMIERIVREFSSYAPPSSWKSG